MKRAYVPSAVCHAGSAPTRNGANSGQRRRIVATMLALAASVGRSDGATWATCVSCGMIADARGRQGIDRLEAGHVVPDAAGGRYCPCNLLPQCGACNADLADLPMHDAMTLRYDSRQGWQGALVADPGPASLDTTGRGRAAWLAP